MASPHCSVSPSFPLRRQNPITTRKLQASLSSLKPSKHINRKNYLRPKLLRTLTKPYPSIPLNPQSAPQNPLNPPEHPPQQHTHINSPQDYDQSLSLIAQEETDEQNQLTLQALQTSPIPEPESIFTTRSVTQLILYFLGLFLFQTIITVWVLKPGNVDEESQNKEENGRKNDGFWLSTSGEAIPNRVGYTDDSLVEKKIVEIRAMAKEVRELEAKKLGKSSNEVDGDGDGDGDGVVPKPVVTKVKTNIQQEVDRKISNFGKKIRSLGEKQLVSKVSSLNNANEVGIEKKLEHSDANAKDDNLVFKKKGKFKNGLSQSRDKPKGFGSDENYSEINGNNKTRASQHTDFRSETDVPNSGSFGRSPEREEDSRFPVDNGTRNDVTEVGEKAEGRDESSVKKLGVTQETGRKMGKERKSSKTGEGMEIEKNKTRSGIIRESSYGLVEPKDLTKLKTDKSSILTRQVGDKQVVKNSRDNQASVENDLWWLNLPYALGIILSRNSETEQPGGFYSLKADDGSSSHFVAFEDQRDASNFCYILEAFFDELGDISADVVPLSIKELKDEMEANGMEIIVVRKGQLQLYAGQPLPEVEMILRSLLR